MPLPASSTTLNGLIDRRIDEPHDVLDVGVEHVLARDLRRGVRAGAGSRAGGNHVADVGDALVAAQRKRLPPHHLHAVVLLRDCARR